MVLHAFGHVLAGREGLRHAWTPNMSSKIEAMSEEAGEEGKGHRHDVLVQDAPWLILEPPPRAQRPGAQQPAFSIRE